MPNTATELRAKLITWHLTDSALPTGSFAHSAGMETFVLSGQIDDAESYGRWLATYLYQASFNEALAVRLAMELATSQLGDTEKVAELSQLDQLCHASQTPRQIRQSMNTMGKRMARVVAITVSDTFLVDEYAAGIDESRYHGNPGIAAGLAFGCAGVSTIDGVHAYLLQMANSMTQNAIRAIPLGQDAGQRALVAAYDHIERAARLTMRHTAAELGVVAPAIEISQMQHEALHARMFMS